VRTQRSEEGWRERGGGSAPTRHSQVIQARFIAARARHRQLIQSKFIVASLIQPQLIQLGFIATSLIQQVFIHRRFIAAVVKARTEARQGTGRETGNRRSKGWGGDGH